MGKILVVDDERDIVQLLSEFLAEKGYEVFTAGNGEAALGVVKKEHPEIVLLDIMMPGMGGIDTLKEIHQIDPTTGVIMITAVSDSELANRAIELGASLYITKPIDLTHLENVVMVKMIYVLEERSRPASPKP